MSLVGKIDFKLPDLDRKTWISLIIMLVLLLSIPFGIYLSQNTQIFKPRAAYTPVRTFYGDVEIPESDKVTPLSRIDTFSCSKEYADQGTGRRICTTPTGCAGNQISRYYNYDEASNSYQCYWSALCVPVDPNCEKVETSPLPASSENLQKALYQEFKISFDDPFFDSESNKQYLVWAWDIVSNIKNTYPYFFQLLQQQYDVIHIGISDAGHREKDYIYLGQNGPAFADVNFFKHSIIHELAHVISGEPGKKLYRNQIKTVLDQEGYLTSYSAGAGKDPACQARDLRSSFRSEYQLEEEFADTVAYLLNPEVPELQYNFLCPPKHAVEEGNPIYSENYSKHKEFIEKLLRAQNLETGTQYPDISSCKFTRAKKAAPIKSNTLRSWMSEIAVKESIPVGVLASVIMHENQDFVGNSDDSHDAIKNNYYYIVSRVNEGINRDTNAIGLYQLSSGRTGTTDHCADLFAVMSEAAKKLGKLVHDKSYYCVNDLDERIRRLCQTDNTVRKKKIFSPDKDFDQNYLNLCNLKDNIAVGGEFLNWKLKIAGKGARAWENDQHLKDAVYGFYGRCTDQTYPFDYCQEVLNDKKACAVSVVTPPNQSEPINIFVNWNKLAGGGRKIYGPFSAASANIERTDVKDNICNGKFVETNIRADYLDGTYIDFEPGIRIVGSNSLCGTSPQGAGPDTTVRNLRYTCLNNNTAVQLRWDPTQKYDLRIDKDPDLANSWTGNCEGSNNPNVDRCLNNIANGFDASILPNTKYKWWVHSLQADQKTENPAVQGGEFVCGQVPAQPVIGIPTTIQGPEKETLAGSCNRTTLALSWKKVTGIDRYQMRGGPVKDGTDPNYIPTSNWTSDPEIDPNKEKISNSGGTFAEGVQCDDSNTYCSYFQSGLIEGTKYKAWVNAVNSAGTASTNTYFPELIECKRESFGNGAYTPYGSATCADKVLTVTVNNQLVDMLNHVRGYQTDDPNYFPPRNWTAGVPSKKMVSNGDGIKCENRSCELKIPVQESGLYRIWFDSYSSSLRSDNYYVPGLVSCGN